MLCVYRTHYRLDTGLCTTLQSPALPTCFPLQDVAAWDLFWVPHSQLLAVGRVGR